MPIWSAVRASFARDLNRQKFMPAAKAALNTDLDLRKIKDGDRFTFGEVLVTARHTPGHTPEHMSYLLAEADHPDEPWAVLTGDSLFVSSAGRPDLLGEKHTKQLAEQQFHTLRDFYLNLPDHVMIYPNHGAGSPCGADIGARIEQHDRLRAKI